MPNDFLSVTSVPPSVPPSSRSVNSRRIFGQFVFLILVLLSAGIGALGGLVFIYSSDLPKVRELEDYRPDVMTEVFANDGTPIGSFALEHRVIVSYNQISPLLRNAVISIEDRHFESHWGVDVLGIIRAAGKDVLTWRKRQGASTLTQQLSRMLFLTPDKSFRRKIQEALLAIQIERYFSKAQIFAMYANQVDLGHGNFGFEAASQFYFSKPMSQLTLPEAATLAGIPNSPSANSPIIHPEASRRRRDVVLRAMMRTGRSAPPIGIALPPLLSALKSSVGITPSRPTSRWSGNFWKGSTARKRLQKGLRVYTTLDIKMQEDRRGHLMQGPA